MHTASSAAPPGAVVAEDVSKVFFSGTDPVWALEDFSLTLEPCTMCAGAIVLSRVQRVVVGAMDPKAGAAGSLYDLVREPRLNHHVELTTGVRGQECGDLLRDFFRARRKR